MSMMTLETLDEFEEVGAVRILKVKRDGHYTMFLKGSIDGVDMCDIFCILKFICSDSRDFRFCIKSV